MKDMQDVADTRLGRSIARRLQGHAHESGIAALANGLDAFAVRAHLIEAADRSIDVQYYIWQADLSGLLLFEALQRAADRGVRVRLLLDDNRASGMDERLAALDAHPNIEVRLFNPFRFRSWRILDYLGDFSRINRRMHNKCFIVDNQVAVIGGRNIGDEYFEASNVGVMHDMDALAIGAVVGEISLDFDRYWSSESSWAIGRLAPRASAGARDALRTAAARLTGGTRAQAYQAALAERPLVQALLRGELSLDWALTHFISDAPGKVLGKSGITLWQRASRILAAADIELDLVSPYVVPHQEGARFLLDLAARGVKVRVLTNSLEATDVAVVHAGYAKWRKRLIEAGIALFEFKRNPSGAMLRSGTGPLGSSASSLHAKLFLVDRSLVFIGSFNFDPRSARLNTENGFIIESRDLARSIGEMLASRLPQRSYAVTMNDGGGLRWLEQRGANHLVHDAEPGVSRSRTFMVRVLSVLPIDWLL
jgi:putative cardiolipin synthase